jgi:hypothetical protein
MMQRSLRRAIRAPIGRIALSNAADGAVLGLHKGGALRAVADEVASHFGGLDATDQDAEGLRRTVEDTCRGVAGKAGLRKGSRHLRANPCPLTDDPARFSTVVTGPTFASLIEPADLRRVLGRLSVTRLASGGITPGSYSETRLMDRTTAARAWRRVSLARDARLGNPLLWITRTDLFDVAVEEAITSGDSRARVVTDRLGLIFPPFHPTNNAMNQRFALHLPSSVVARKQAYRPTTVEAAGYARFKVRPVASPYPPAGWGRALDLSAIAAGRGLADGLDEITVDAISASDFQTDELIEVEYLGTLAGPRGVTAGVDCDETVASLMSNGRTVADLMEAFR